MKWKPAAVGTCATCGKLVRFEWAPGLVRQVPTCRHLEEITEPDPAGMWRPNRAGQIAAGALMGAIAAFW